MKKSIMILFAAGLLLAVAVPQLFAANAKAKTTTLSGHMVCGRCVLHLSKQCQNVLEVKNGGKTVNYWLTQNEVSKKFHPNICQTSGENVTVTGTVAKKGGKEIMVATTIKPAK